MKRKCPCCGSDEPNQLYHFVFTDGGRQVVSTCGKCGMGYASDTVPADYGEESLYAAPLAQGSQGKPGYRAFVGKSDNATLVDEVDASVDEMTIIAPITGG